MSEGVPVPSPSRYAGFLLVLLAALILILAWLYLLPILDGTMVDELKYLLYAAFAVGVLSAFHWLEEKLFSSTG